ncbi:MAG: TRAP transporter large permease [Clostridiales bacterium]|mgnify:FL=1|nr:TRAP transporter large permease [Clostridiales bacterium]
MNPALLLFVLLCVLMFLGIPIAVSLCMSTVAVMVFCLDVNIMSFPQKLFAGADSFPLMAVIFFMIAGELMLQGGISKRLINVCKLFLARVRGSLAIISFAACGFFGALSGSALATTAAIGGIMYPEMQEDGTYDDSFSLTVQAVGGTLGPMIPPSIPLILFGMVASCSVGSLFAATIVPGLIVCLAYCLCGYAILKKRNMGTRHYVRPERKPGEKNVFLDAIWALLTPVIILGGIYSGIFSPTESAAVACVYALIVGTCIYKELTLKKIYNALFNAMKGSVAVMFLCTCATFFGWLLTYLGTTNQIINFLTETISSKLALFLIIDLIVLIAGMFVDGGTIILIVGPLVCPAAAALGISMIHLGVVFCIGIAVGNITPPFGACLFVANSLDKSIKVEKLFREVIPFCITATVVVILLTLLEPVCTLFA